MSRRRRFRENVKTMGDIARTASTALKVATTVASLINVEFKYVDQTSSLTPNSTGTIFHITDIAQGDTMSTRDGDSVKLKSIQAKWYGKQHSSATNTILRIIWFIDTVGASTPTISELLGSGADVNAFRNLDNRGRFVILKDVTFNLGDNTTFDGSWYKKLNMQTLWHDGTGSGVTSNHLYMAYISNEATNTPNLYIRHRVRYLDN